MLDGQIPESPGALNDAGLAIHKEWCPNCPLRPHKVWPTMKELALQVCERYGVTLDELHSDRRTRRITIPRQEFMALAYELPHTSLPMIAHFLRPDMDHTSVLHGVRAHRSRCSP